MPSPSQNPLEVAQFDGGITDNYLDANLNQYQTANNLLVKDNGKFETRSGLNIYDSSIFRVPHNERVNASILHDSEIFFIGADQLFYPTSSTWNTLTGPSSNQAFFNSATSSYFSWAEWNKHLTIVGDSFFSPQKVYKDSGSTWRIRNAGLPKITLTSCIEMANDLKAKLAAHYIDAAQHTTAIDTTNTIVAADSYTFSSLVTLVTELLTICRYNRICRINSS